MARSRRSHFRRFWLVGVQDRNRLEGRITQAPILQSSYASLVKIKINWIVVHGNQKYRIMFHSQLHLSILLFQQSILSKQILQDRSTIQQSFLRNRILLRLLHRVQTNRLR